MRVCAFIVRCNRSTSDKADRNRPLGRDALIYVYALYYSMLQLIIRYVGAFPSGLLLSLGIVSIQAMEAVVPALFAWGGVERLCCHPASFPVG